MNTSGYVDLHCHWVPGIDDGVKSVEDGILLLEGLGRIGFSTVLATPHMRPGMFNNDRALITSAFASMKAALPPGLPDVALASEHFFDDVVFGRLMKSEGLPYPGGKSVLLEFPPLAFPIGLQARLFNLKRKGLSPVIAHPERYEPVWKDIGSLEPLLDAGAFLLLDLCAIVGKYGRAAQRAAETLLDEGAYDAACSDAHKSADVAVVEQAISTLKTRCGESECDRLLSKGPRAILRGTNSV